MKWNTFELWAVTLKTLSLYVNISQTSSRLRNLYPVVTEVSKQEKEEFISDRKDFNFLKRF